MTRVKLNLASGSVQEREVVSAFNFNGIKYIVFDGESTGSMGLPIILVSKELTGKVVGITDAEEWKTTKDCLKKIISGDKLEYAFVAAELSADDIYYRQLTLPIASFDILKSSYEAPEEPAAPAAADNSPIFEQITPEDLAGDSLNNVEPVAPTSFSAPIPEAPIVPEAVSEPAINNEPIINPVVADVNEPIAPAFGENVVPESVVTEAPAITESNNSNYEELKKEFLAGAEELFNKLYNELNH